MMEIYEVRQFHEEGFHMIREQGQSEGHAWRGSTCVLMRNLMSVRLIFVVFFALTYYTCRRNILRGKA